MEKPETLLEKTLTEAEEEPILKGQKWNDYADTYRDYTDWDDWGDWSDWNDYSNPI